MKHDRARKIALADLNTFKSGSESNFKNGLRLSAFEDTNHRGENDSHDKYKRAGDTTLSVRYVPIVIEGSSDEDEKKIFPCSSKISSSPRINTSRILNKTKDVKVFDTNCSSTLQASNVPPYAFNEIQQSSTPLDFNSNKRNQRRQSTSRPGNYNLRGEYFVKSELSPSADCPLHGWATAVNNRHVKQGYKTREGMSATDPSKGCKKKSSASSSVLKQGDAYISEKPTSLPGQFTRNKPGQWSLREKKHSLDSKTAQLGLMEKPFQRRWSMRLPSTSTPSGSSFQSPTLSSISRSNSSFLLQLPEYFRQKKDQCIGSPVDDRLNSTHKSLAALSLITSMNKNSTFASLNESSATKYIHQSQGILKGPGKRRVSSSNRVDFLDNLREQEIPGRQR